MSDALDITEYLARGGRLTSPENAPSRYRAELLRIMATFVDSTLAGSAGFADVINDGPGIAERIAAARIVADKLDHAGRVLRIMGDFGADSSRYATSHPWTARLPRDADIGTARSEHDMRLPVFNAPLDGWADAVVMNLLMATAVDVQLEDLVGISYQPLADVLREIAPVEARHGTLAEAGIARLRAGGTPPEMLEASVAYWWPRVSASFGQPGAERMALLRTLGLRRTFGDEQRRDWKARAAKRLKAVGLDPA